MISQLSNAPTIKTFEGVLATGGSRDNGGDDSGDGEEREGDLDHDCFLFVGRRLFGSGMWMKNWWIGRKIPCVFIP